MNIPRVSSPRRCSGTGGGTQEHRWKSPLQKSTKALCLSPLLTDFSRCSKIMGCMCACVSGAPGTEVAPGDWSVEPGGRAAGAGQRWTPPPPTRPSFCPQLRLQASSPPTVYQEPPKHFSLQSWLDTLHSEWPAAVSPNRDLRPGRRLLYFEAALNCASAETCLFSPSEEIKILKCLLAKGTAASLSLKCKSARSTLARARVGWRKAACPCDLTPSISPI